LVGTSYISLTIVPGPQARTAIEGPSITSPGACSSAFKVTTLDSVYNQTNVAAPTTVTLSTTGTTLFYSDSSCSTLLPSNQLTIPTSSDSSLFYAKTAAAETATLASVVAGNVGNGSFKLQTNSTAHNLIVSTGGGAVCYVLDGIVKCWGSNTLGQLGNGTNTDSLTPVTVSGLSGVTQIANCGRSFCALNSSGVWCWGNDGDGELGDGHSFTTSNVPVQPTVLGSGASITQLVGTSGSFGGGDDGFCVIQSGTVYCWTGTNHPVAVSLPRPAVSVSVQGYDVHACALLNDGTVYCWGRNANGQLGDGTTNDSSTPVQVLGISGATAVTTLESTSCAIVSGAVYCWGDQYTLTAENINFPGTAAQVNGAGAALSIVGSDGSYWYSGYVDASWIGYSGDGTGNSYLPPAFKESIMSGVISMAPFLQGACVVVQNADGQPSLECWGANDSETFSFIGDGSISISYAPFATFSLN